MTYFHRLTPIRQRFLMLSSVAVAFALASFVLTGDSTLSWMANGIIVGIGATVNLVMNGLGPTFREERDDDDS